MPIKLLGIGLAVGSFYLVLKPKGKMKIDWKFAVLPILLLVGIGINDTAMKYLQHHYFDGDESQFLTVVFFVAFLIGSIALIIQSIEINRAPRWNSIIMGFILGLLNFGATYFLIISMFQMPLLKESVKKFNYLKIYYLHYLFFSNPHNF